MESFFEAIKYILDWFSSGIYLFFEEWFKEAVAWFVVATVKAKIWAVGFSWDVAKIVLQNLGLSQYISSAWAGLDSQVLGYVTFFRIPDALNIIFQAYVTRLTLVIMGW
ncbi:MAG TPA: DUF2523 family protein [Pedobacter sp.]|jgi:hypothetical protein